MTSPFPIAHASCLQALGPRREGLGGSGLRAIAGTVGLCWHRKRATLGDRRAFSDFGRQGLFLFDLR